MLEKKKLDENNVVTIIGPGTTITGNVESKGTVRVEGTVNGRIDCEDTIVIHESGHVKADLVGGQVIISGTVEGNTFAHDRLEVTNQGKIVGNITAPRISIAEGVIFEGQCTMKPQGQMKPPTKEGQAPKEAKDVKDAKDAKEPKLSKEAKEAAATN